MCMERKQVASGPSDLHDKGRASFWLCIPGSKVTSPWLTEHRFLQANPKREHPYSGGYLSLWWFKILVQV